MRTSLLFVLVVAISWPTGARAEDAVAHDSFVPREPVLAPSADPTNGVSLDATHADALAALRMRHRQARIDEGIGLLMFALASVVVGGGTAIAGFVAMPEDTRWMSIGIGTVGWGAINAIFSLILFDLGGGSLRDIDADRALRGRELDWAREDAARDSYGTAAVVAVNAGLDVFYIAAGILLFVIGDLAMPDDQWLEGYGIAMASQGTALLAFDLTTWMAATTRGDELRELFRDEAREE